MSIVVNKPAPDGDPAFADFEIIRNANTPDFPPAQWVINSPNLAALIGTGDDQTPEFPRIYWIVDPPASQNLRLMTAPEQAAANTDPANVTAARSFKKLALETQAFGFLLTRYPSPVYEGLMLISQEAIGQRRNYLEDWLDWATTVYDALTVVENAVDAAVDVPAIEALTLDLTPFEGTDPLVSIQGAMSL